VLQASAALAVLAPAPLRTVPSKEKPMRIPSLVVVSSALALLAPPAFAQTDARVLTVYTYGSFPGEYGPGGVIKERFEDVCECTLEWVTSDDAGTLLSRLRLEGASTAADVVLGLDTNLMAEAKATGLFAPHSFEFGDLDLDLPVAWTDDTFLPFDWGWFAFVYDETRLPSPPQSLAELVDGDGPPITIQDPRTSTPGLGLLLWLRNVYGDEAGAAWERLAPKIVTVTQGWSEAYGLFLEGEAEMVLSYTSSPAYHVAVEGDARYKAAIFPEGHELQVEVAAMTATADDPELARAFLAFMLADPFQSAIPEGNWMYPARLPEDGLPPSFNALDTPGKSHLTPPEEVAANRRAWTDEWLAAMSR
jgi:thiamine transport system substrate-binding protein